MATELFIPPASNKLPSPRFQKNKKFGKLCLIVCFWETVFITDHMSNTYVRNLTSPFNSDCFFTKNILYFRCFWKYGHLMVYHWCRIYSMANTIGKLSRWALSFLLSSLPLSPRHQEVLGDQLVFLLLVGILRDCRQFENV